MDLFSLRGWPFALLVFAGVVALNFSVFTTRSLSVRHINPLAVFGQIICFICLVGFTEEPWFRGIWFAHFPDRPAVAIIVGSVFFGLMHIHIDVVSAGIALFVGLLFAVTRYCGALLLVLAIAHELIDFTHFDLAPSIGFRFGLANTLAVNMSSYLVLLCLLFWLP